MNWNRLSWLRASCLSINFWTQFFIQLFLKEIFGGGRGDSFTFCGEVEDVVGALTPVGSGVAQVFHDLLVGLRLLLVAEVEEGKEEEGQEAGEEVKGGNQVEETTTTWMAMMMVVSGVRTRLELEPNVSKNERAQGTRLHAHDARSQWMYL